jgi:hypothetical protein
MSTSFGLMNRLSPPTHRVISLPRSNRRWCMSLRKAQPLAASRQP